MVAGPPNLHSMEKRDLMGGLRTRESKVREGKSQTSTPASDVKRRKRRLGERRKFAGGGRGVPEAAVEEEEEEEEEGVWMEEEEVEVEEVERWEGVEERAEFRRRREEVGVPERACLEGGVREGVEEEVAAAVRKRGSGRNAPDLKSTSITSALLASSSVSALD